MWKCYECEAGGNPSGFSATTAAIEAHFRGMNGNHSHGFYTYGGAKGDRTKVEVGPHLLYGQEIVESSAWERLKEGVKLATGGFYLGKGGPFGSEQGKDAAATTQTDMIRQRFTVLDVYRETHDTITLLSDFPAAWEPGQFSMIGTAATGEVPISFSGKRDGYTMQTIRKVGRVTSVLTELQPGATITQRGPFGHGWRYKDIGNLLIIAGGCGMAPLMPVLDERPDAMVLYGAKEARDFYHLPDGGNVTWVTLPGLVTDLIDSRHADYCGVLICGPEAMMHAVAGKLVSLGMDPRRIQVSLERKMTCAIGLCEQCTVGGGKLCCKDGPVFTYDQIGA